MNRTDRLLAIVLELQTRKYVRAEDLAATFEVSKRTIYRDILALDESGVPIVAAPGRGYSLGEGYFLPPLIFETNEAITLLLGTDFTAQIFDAFYQDAAQAARRKILAVLPEARRDEVMELESSIQLIALNGPWEPETLRQMRQAIIQRRVVRFHYNGTTREADPYTLIHISGVWVLVAYCHLRRARRHFRLDRMENAVILDRTFTRQPEFDVQTDDLDDRPIVVRALFDHETAQRVRENPSFYQVSQDVGDEGLIVTLRIRQPADVLHWLLSWGSHVRVLEPDAVRRLLAQEAQAILENHC